MIKFLELTLRRKVKRERAFDLAQIESKLGKEEEIWWQRFQMADSNKVRKERCRLKCDKNFLLGLDMVKVFDNDLKLFCRMNDQHDWCLRSCGFSGQKVNMYTYICKYRYEELAYLLPCYKSAVPTLRRQCGTNRCNLHTTDKIDKTVIRYENRCRLLICDIRCATDVLSRSCGGEYGGRAAHFIMIYTSRQVSLWMENLTKELYLTKNHLVEIPASCSRLLCQESDLRRCIL
ncbi:unnamed protein product [Onchocerca flexuosa]|uniref:Protein Wnt n=1 Tax=Onchocerca flexuosa TaxID=387005 RepID=A0A183H5H8_9BILA|nr:unnamed protein product [Onchocerca flexuosa]